MKQSDRSPHFLYFTSIPVFDRERWSPIAASPTVTIAPPPATAAAAKSPPAARPVAAELPPRAAPGARLSPLRERCSSGLPDRFSRNSRVLHPAGRFAAEGAGGSRTLSRPGHRGSQTETSPSAEGRSSQGIDCQSQAARRAGLAPAPAHCAAPAPPAAVDSQPLSGGGAGLPRRGGECGLADGGV